ncbi:MAG TPA: hypothetical protein VHP14_17900 [Anaerolineales bacterium]|nr:hypothetical protein [Anaerolineales bacterium]
MIKRVFTSLAMILIYFFLSVQGIKYTVPIDTPLTETGAYAARQYFFATEVSRRNMHMESTGLPTEKSVPSTSTVARYNEYDRSWTFSAKVLQLKDVSIYGRPGTIAQIEYLRKEQPQYGWAVVKIGDFYFGEEANRIAPGQEIRLEVSGEYVSSKGVNWEVCPHDDKYCQRASFIEGFFPMSEDYNGLTICPSNELIYSGYAPDDWINGMLAWKIEVEN